MRRATTTPSTTGLVRAAVTAIAVTTAIVAAAVSGAVPAARAGTGGPRSETARAGSWRATFTYVDHRGAWPLPVFANLHLVLRRGTTTLVDEPVTSRFAGRRQGDLWPGGIGTKRSLVFRRLDGEPQPELVLTLYTGGAHCCFLVQVYDPNVTPLRKVEADFLDAGATLETLAGAAVFVGADDSFDYAFTDYGDSAAPIAIWRYNRGRFGNVTSTYPAAIGQDARRWWSMYEQRRSHADVRGDLAAWAADEARLGRQQTAKTKLLAIASSGGLERGVFGAKGTAYVAQLWKFLAKHRYLR